MVNTCGFYQLNGNISIQSTLINDTLQSTNGCDSIVIYDINIGMPESNNVNLTACDQYVWNGVIYNQSGVYISAFVNSQGCDSVVTLDLTINNFIIGDTLNEFSCDSYNG